jgi:hypothetical protein
MAAKKSSRKSRKPTSPGSIPREPKLPIERVQVGARMEKSLVKVLKAVAEYADLSLGEMLEEIVLHAFDGVSTFGPKARAKISQLKKVYELDYDVHASFRFIERKN